MASAGDVLNKENTEKALYPARGLAGGGQLEIRMEVSPDHPDPDIRGVARRVKFFNLESWHTEWTAVAQKNEELAKEIEKAPFMTDDGDLYSWRGKTPPPLAIPDWMSEDRSKKKKSSLLKDMLNKQRKKAT